VNLVDRGLEVYREPAPDLGAVRMGRFQSVTTLGSGAAPVPLAFPQRQILVVDLLV
jgi:hypothetical protein